MVARIRAGRRAFGRAALLTLAVAAFVVAAGLPAQAQTVYFEFPQPVSRCQTVYYFDDFNHLTSSQSCTPSYNVEYFGPYYDMNGTPYYEEHYVYQGP